MDLQKVASQASATANQRLEGAKEGAAALAASFSDMIRFPMFKVGDLLGSLDNKQSAPDSPEEILKPVERQDSPRPISNDDRRTESRDNTRDDTVRADGRDENRGGDSTRQSSDSNRDNPDDGRKSAAAEKSDPDQKADPDQNDQGDVQKVAENDTDAVDNSPVEVNDAEQVDTAPDAADGGVIVDAKAGFEQALEGLIAAAQNHSSGETVKDAAQALNDNTAGPKKEIVANILPAMNPEAAKTSDGTPGDIKAGGDQAGIPKQAQPVLDRVGPQAQGTANNTAPVDQSLVGQQAAALSDTLKSDKPLKIQVNVENRSAVVSQSNQPLSANGIAAQEAANNQVARTDTPRVGNSDMPQQAALPRVDGTATSVQAQTLITAAAGATAVSESGFGNASLQSGNAGLQGPSQGGIDGIHATTPGGTITSQQTASAEKALQAQAPRAPETARPVVQQISVNIAKAVGEGLDRITIQLRPDNLGRVEVRLEVAHNGRVSATIIADRPEVLELLRNDARNLERALQDAGLNAQGGDLTFNLRDQQENPGETQSGNRMAGDDDKIEDGSLEAEMAARLLNGEIGDIISDTRIDIRA